MDEDYAQRLRNWLRAEPEATPRQAAEQREWLREVPEPGGRAAHDRLPAPGDANPVERAQHNRLPAAETPEPGAGTTHDRPPAAGDPDPGDSWTVRGYLPETPGDDAWVCPVITLPVPRPSRENGCRMSEAEARSRWNHPTNANRRAQAADMGAAEARSPRSPAGTQAPDPTDRRAEALDNRPATHPGQPPEPTPMSEAEARSRWNHPANWHRRRREAGQRRDQPRGL